MALKQIENYIKMSSPARPGGFGGHSKR